MAYLLSSCWLLISLNSVAATYYVDQQAGRDTNDGLSTETAFQTIGQAITAMASGDECLIAAGVYREVITINQSNVSLRALDPGQVFITAARPVNDWQPYQDNIYRTTLPEGSAPVSQVFVDRAPMGIARFPNNTSQEWLRPTVGVATGGSGTRQTSMTLQDEAIAQSGIDWTGAQLWVLPGPQWVSFSRPVSSQSGNSITFAGNEVRAYVPEAGTRYFLYGTLAALDAEREWYYEEGSRTLYLYAPGGVDPSSRQVEIRTDFYSLTVGAEASNVTIEGLYFYGANLKLAGSSSTIDACRFFYTTPWFEIGRGWNRGELDLPAFDENAPGLGVTLAGSDNTIKNSEIAYSWGDGVSLLGTNQRVENCLIHHVDASAADCAGVATSGSGHQVVNNTIHNTGRSGVLHRLTSDLLIQYNDIYQYGVMTSDLGGTYTYQTFWANPRDADTEISYNWIHEAGSGFTDPKHSQRDGVYIDNRSQGFLIHHNVVWEPGGVSVGIRTNLPTTNNGIYHNTLWNVARAMRVFGDVNPNEDQRVYNNLSNDPNWYGSDVRANLVTPNPGFVDPANGDFRLTEDSPARNYYGVAEDLLNGSFENGTSGWETPGATPEVVSRPVRSGSSALRLSARTRYWGGVRQDLTELVKQYGKGTYTIEVWMRTVSGNTTALLRANINDAQFDQKINVAINSEGWTQVQVPVAITDAAALNLVVLEVMSAPGAPLADLLVDDCRVTVPASAVTANLSNGSFENGLNGWITTPRAAFEVVSSPARRGSSAVRVSAREAYWSGVRQDLTELVKQYGNGTYTMEAWVRTGGGTTTALLRANIDDVQFDQKANAALSSEAWTRVRVPVAITNVAALETVTLELMTNPGAPLTDLYVDDCRVVVPGGDVLDEAIIIPSINNQVADGQPDAGAYEYGENWTAGSSVTISELTDWLAGSSDGDSGSSNDNGTVVVRARGSVGNEQMRLLVDGQIVDTWTVGTNTRDYAYSEYNGGVLAVRFDNDVFTQQEDRNLFVDYVEVCGETLQAEEAERSVDCGITQQGFVALWCNSDLNFGSRSCTASQQRITSARQLPKSEAELIVYPNPVGPTRQLVVKRTGQYLEEALIYSMQGQLLSRQRVEGTESTVDVSGLGSGTYYLQLSGQTYPFIIP